MLARKTYAKILRRRVRFLERKQYRFKDMRAQLKSANARCSRHQARAARYEIEAEEAMRRLARVENILDAPKVKKVWGGGIDIDYVAFAEALGPSQANELHEVIEEVYS